MQDEVYIVHYMESVRVHKIFKSMQSAINYKDSKEVSIFRRNYMDDDSYPQGIYDFENTVNAFWQECGRKALCPFPYLFVQDDKGQVTINEDEFLKLTDEEILTIINILKLDAMHIIKYVVNE
jgi:hypothetical protein